MDPLVPLGIAFLILVLGGLAATLALKLRVGPPTVFCAVMHGLFAVGWYARFGLWAGDAMLYDRLGVNFANSFAGNEDRAIQVTSGKEGFPHLLGAIYGVFGHAPILGITTNVLLTTLLVPLSVATAARIGAPRLQTAWLVALFPPFLLWGSLLLREALSWVLIALIVFSVSGITRNRSDRATPWDWPILVVSLALFMYVRGTAAILVGAAALLAISWASRQRFWTAVLGLLSVIVAAPALTGAFDRVAGGYDVKELNRVRGALSREAGTSFEVAQVSDLGSLVRSAPSAVARGFLGPFPWEWPRVGLFATVEALCWFFVLAMAVIGWVNSGFSRRMVGIVAPAVALVVALSLASGNYGTLERLREQAAIAIVPLVPLGVRALKQRRQGARQPRPHQWRGGASGRVLRKPGRASAGNTTGPLSTSGSPAHAPS